MLAKDARKICERFASDSSATIDQTRATRERFAISAHIRARQSTTRGRCAKDARRIRDRLTKEPRAVLDYKKSCANNARTIRERCEAITRATRIRMAKLTMRRRYAKLLATCGACWVCFARVLHVSGAISGLRRKIRVSLKMRSECDA